MTMFKFRRSRNRNNPAVDDDDDEPMRGTSYTRRSSFNSSNVSDSAGSGGGGGGGRKGGRSLPGYDDHQKQKRSSSNPGSSTRHNSKNNNKPALRNYSKNTRNKQSGHANNNQHHGNNNGGPSSKVSWISDTCSETDVTETWVSDLNSSQGSDNSSEEGGESNHSGSRISEASGEFSRSEGSAVSGEFSQNSHDTSHASIGSSEHDDDDDDDDDDNDDNEGNSHLEKSEDWGKSENSAILFSSGELKKAVAIGVRGGGSNYADDEEASYESVGDFVQVQKDNAPAKSKNSKKLNPPPPPKWKNSVGGMNDSSLSLGSAKSSQSIKSRNINGRSRGSKKGDAKKNNKNSQNKNIKSGAKSVGGGTVASNTTNKSRSSPPNPTIRPPEHQEEQRMKPPSMKGMPATEKSKIKKKSQSNSRAVSPAKSVSSAPQVAAPSSDATVATSASVDGVQTPAELAKESNTEVAAMQQLAYLVVSLRSDLREANSARDELEGKLEQLEKNQGAQGNTDSSKVKQLKKENAGLHADVDAFLLEQDDLRNEVNQLTEDKSSLNDIISRLKRDQAAERNAAAKSMSNNAVDGRIDKLAEENHKLELEIQLLVGEKSHLVSLSDSTTGEMEELTKSLKEVELRVDEKERTSWGMQEKIDSLEGEFDRLEKEHKEDTMNVAVLEDELERKEGEMDSLEATLKSETDRGTLLRQRLNQLEKQKAEISERNSAMDGVMMGLKKKTEHVLKERNSMRQEINELKDENKRVSDELQLNSSRVIAKEAGDGDTLLNLQKMISSLEESKEKLEEELDHKDEESKLDTARVSQLESKLRVAQEMNKRSMSSSHSATSQSMEDMSVLKEQVAALTAMNESVETKTRSLEEEQAIIEEEFETLKEASDEEAASLNASNERLLSEIKTLEDKQTVIKDELEAYKNSGVDPVNNGGEEGESSVLKECIATLTAENEARQSTIRILEEEQTIIRDELESYKESSANSVADLEVLLNAKQSSFVNLMDSKSTPSSQNQASLDTMANLQNMIDSLEEDKDGLEEEINESTDAIAMLEDELDRKDAEVKALLVKLTMQQQRFSQVDKCKTALAERNARLAFDNDDLNTQIKILNMTKNLGMEEIQTLKAMKNIAEEDQEEALLRKSETQQEVDEIMDKFKQKCVKSNEQISNLEQDVYILEKQNMELVQDLDEGNDALTMLREALKELEGGKIKKDAMIKELKSKLADKEVAVETMDVVQSKLQSEHQVSVDTIATLQKMITSLEKSKEDLEEELDASSAALIDLKEQLKKKTKVVEVMDLEDKLKKATEKNGMLSQRIVELTEANKKMKDQVKDLGESLAKVSIRHVALQGPSVIQSNSTLLVSTDPLATCDALISELKNQIKEIVVTRNAALEEIEYLKSDGASVASSKMGDGSHFTKTTPPPADTVTDTPSSKLESPTPVSVAVQRPKVRKCKSSSALSRLDVSTRSDPSGSEGDERSLKTMEKSLGPSLAPSNAPSQAGSRGSSLLEAAKKLCDQLDEKRSQAASEKISIDSNMQEEAAAVAVAASSASKYSKGNPEWEEEPVKNVVDHDIDDNISAKEVKEESPKDSEKPEVKAKPSSTGEEKKQDNNSKSSRNKGRFDIDQLTSIYFEKCGMSVSKFSDLSSDSSSFRRRKSTGPNTSNGANTVTKKVNICRNGIFMGTYEGDLNPDGQRHGFGVLLCDNGNSYEGEWKKDKRDGLGIARYSSGDVYDGQWQRGKRQGHGVMYIEAGDTYIGSWDNGLKHGAGTYHWADGEVDVSWYEEDGRVGEGVRWNASRSKAYKLIRGTKKEELSLDEAYMTAEKLGLNLEKFDSGAP